MSAIVVKSGSKKLIDFFNRVDDKAAYVGVPANNTGRSENINNASLLFLHERGSAANNLPARPVMKLGIAKCKEKVSKILGDSLKNRISRLDDVGAVAQLSIRDQFGSSALAPLKQTTINERAARKNRIRKIGMKAVPLIDTGKLRRSIDYIVK